MSWDFTNVQLRMQEKVIIDCGRTKENKFKEEPLLVHNVVH